jgi:phage tail sheath protein FI
MLAQPTYPGVCIEELPSGVETIAGVSTSTAVFLGRAKQGPMDFPVLYLSFPDSERTFSSEYADSDLARQVRLFFENGGARCYVKRVAQGADAAKVTVKTEDEVPTLKLTAKSAGAVGEVRFGAGSSKEQMATARRFFQ